MGCSSSLSMILAALFAAILTSLFTSASAAALTVSSYAGLVAAAELANSNAKVCNRADGCLGEPVEVTLVEDILLQGPLPGLQNNALFSITGACIKRKQQRCIIDGQLQFQMFPINVSMPYGPPSVLELSGLILQRAKGGVLANTWSQVKASSVIFRYNIEGTVLGVGFFGGAPLHTYIGCKFLSNQGTAIRFGSSKLGLAKDGLGLLVRKSLFWGNSGYAKETGLLDGGAVIVSGRGSSLFDDVVFEANTAVGSGGAVFADETRATFHGVTFKNNSAPGGGGALSGTCGVYNNVTVSFCTSYFDGNTASAENINSSALLFTSPGIGDIAVHFCDTPIPYPGTTITQTSPASTTNGTGSECSTSYCFGS